jgi:hypothetical protein
MSKVTLEFKVDGVRADPASVVLANSGETFGVKRDDTSAVIVAANTAMTKLSTGLYEYEFTDPALGLTYSYSVKYVIGDDTFYRDGTVIGPTTSNITANQYVSESDATQYVNNNKLKRGPWLRASVEDRNIAIVMATRAINRLAYKGQRASSTQVNEFPRGTDTEVPQDIKDACAELAYAYLDGRDAEFEFDNLVVLGKRFGSVSTTSDPKATAHRHVAAGIPSLEAWSLLLPYLKLPDTFEITRVD